MDNSALKIEEIFRVDDRDRITEQFGAFEQSIAYSVFLFTALPIILFPVLQRCCRGKITFTIIIIYMISLLLLIQHRFRDIVFLSGKIKEFISQVHNGNSRVRV